VSGLFSVAVYRKCCLVPLPFTGNQLSNSECLGNNGLCVVLCTMFVLCDTYTHTHTHEQFLLLAVGSALGWSCFFCMHQVESDLKADDDDDDDDSGDGNDDDDLDLALDVTDESQPLQQDYSWYVLIICRKRYH